MNTAQPSPRPWKVHRTGSHIGIKDASGKFVIRKVVNMLSHEKYEQLSADFVFICGSVNDDFVPPGEFHYSGEHSPGQRSRRG